MTFNPKSAKNARKKSNRGPVKKEGPSINYKDINQHTFKKFHFIN